MMASLPIVPTEGTGLARYLDEIRRFRAVLSGNLFGAKNKYFLQLAFAPREMDVRDGVVHGTPVYDAYLQFEQLRDLTLEAKEAGLFLGTMNEAELFQSLPEELKALADFDHHLAGNARFFRA